MSIDGISGVGHAFDRRMEDEETDRSDAEISDQPRSSSLLLLAGDMNAEVAALVILSAEKQRETNRDVQLAEEATLERAERAQIEALHDKAADIRMAGLVDGAFGMGSGFLTMRSASAISEDDKLLFKGGASASEAGGKAFGGLYRACQEDDEARAQTHEHEAAHHRRNLDDARDAVREGQDLLERALDFYKQSQQGAADAASSSIRRG